MNSGFSEDDNSFILIPLLSLFDIIQPQETNVGHRYNHFLISLIRTEHAP